MRQSSLTRILLCAMAMLAFAHEADADVIVQTDETIGTTYGNDGDGGSYFGGEFNQFNASLGTLQTVSLSISGTTMFTIDYVGPSCSPGSCPSLNYAFSVGYSFNAPGFPITVINGGPFFTIDNVSGVVVAPNDVMRSGDALYSGNSTDLAAYVGVGVISVVGGISEDSDFCASGLSCTDSMDISTTLTYTYAPVSEPSSGRLMIGLLLIFVVATSSRKIRNIGQ